jgi:phosphomannomutase/phosphoglucomutase
MIVPAHAFREYGIRGIADRDLTDGVAKGIGQGFATLLGAGELPVRVAVGRDCRVSRSATSRWSRRTGR